MSDPQKETMKPVLIPLTPEEIEVLSRDGAIITKTIPVAGANIMLEIKAYPVPPFAKEK